MANDEIPSGERESGSGDSPNAPVTPILGGFDSKFPPGVGSGSASGRLDAPGSRKKESPFD